MTDTRSKLSDSLRQKWLDACDGKTSGAMDVAEACLKLGLQEENAQSKYDNFSQARRFYLMAAEAPENKDDYAYAMAALASKLGQDSTLEPIKAIALMYALYAPEFVEAQYVLADERVNMGYQGSAAKNIALLLEGLEIYEACLDSSIHQQNMLIFNFIKEDMNNISRTIEQEIDGIDPLTQNEIRSALVKSTRKIAAFDMHCEVRNIPQSPS